MAINSLIMTAGCPRTAHKTYAYVSMSASSAILAVKNNPLDGTNSNDHHARVGLPFYKDAFQESAPIKKKISAVAYGNMLLSRKIKKEEAALLFLK